MRLQDRRQKRLKIVRLRGKAESPIHFSIIVIVVPTIQSFTDHHQFLNCIRHFKHLPPRCVVASFNCLVIKNVLSPSQGDIIRVQWEGPDQSVKAHRRTTGLIDVQKFDVFVIFLDVLRQRLQPFIHGGKPRRLDDVGVVNPLPGLVVLVFPHVFDERISHLVLPPGHILQANVRPGALAILLDAGDPCICLLEREYIGVDSRVLAALVEEVGRFVEAAVRLAGSDVGGVAALQDDFFVRARSLVEVLGSDSGICCKDK
mmetsp:Transcript_15649/g.34165  ORF Transcript_15649/g.34165 Transcript_15649/m.34165 type:complete len:259 (-) Transcript_15649:496-1272(-)